MEALKMPDEKPKHFYQHHPGVGLLDCVRAYQADGGPKGPNVLRVLRGMPRLSTGNSRTELFLSDGLCQACGFDEEFHRLKESDYLGEEANPHRVALQLQAAEESKVVPLR